MGGMGVVTLLPGCVESSLGHPGSVGDGVARGAGTRVSSAGAGEGLWVPASDQPGLGSWAGAAVLSHGWEMP